MKKLPYPLYLDKVLGGWIGKCIGGTIGAQVEATKELMNFTLETAFPKVIPPNDDLDLQVLWLETIQEKGIFITSADLADAWMKKCWYPFNEYGNFKRNYAKGIQPPVSGSFDNAFFETGEGCPIRAEIWGFISPANPALAAKYAYIDGCLDHSEQSIGAEQMWAAICADAFFESDIKKLILAHKRFLPAGSAVQGCVDSILDSYERKLDWRTTRRRMLISHGAPEACDAPVNTGLAAMALLYGGGDFEKTQLLALNAGYDTDCTCATAGAILGQILGAGAIPERWKRPIGDTFVCGINLSRADFTLQRLAEDTVAAGIAVSAALNKRVRIAEKPPVLPNIPKHEKPPARLKIEVNYQGAPSIAWGEAKKVSLRLVNETARSVRGQIVLDGPRGWLLMADKKTISLEPRRKASVGLEIIVPRNLREIAQRNIITAKIVDESKTVLAQESFGLSGAAPWHCMGIFFDTYDTARSAECPWLKDGKYTSPTDARAWQHHFANIDKPYIVEGAFDYAGRIREMTDLLGPACLMMAHAMELPVEKLIGLQGEMCVYLMLNIVSPEDRKVYFAIGNTDGLRVWLNGGELAKADEFVPWTPYNLAIPADLKKGMNRVVVKLVRRSESLRFSFGVRRREGDKPFNWQEWSINLSYALEPGLAALDREI